jgi:rhodanese-related sulfurtransferase
MKPAPAAVERVSAQELAAWLASGEPPLVLDVRRREAWAAEGGGIPGAVWLPLDEVPERARDLPRERPLVVYCS